MKHCLSKIFTIASAIFLYGVAINNTQADDTDIYVNPALPAASEPLVMFILDWRPNLGATQCNAIVAGATAAQIEADCGYSTALSTALFNQGAAVDGSINLLEALRGVLGVVLDPLDSLKIGFMISHGDDLQKPGGGCTAGVPDTLCSNGAYIPFGFRSLQTSDANGTKAAFDALLADIPQPAGNGHPYQGKELYFELFRYLTGQGIWNGHHGFEDFEGDGSKNLDHASNEPGPSWDTFGIDEDGDTFVQGDDDDVENAAGTTYISPITGACAKIFAINFIFGVRSADADSDAQIQDTVANGGMGITLSGGANDQFEQVIEFMNDADLADETSPGSGVPVYGTAPILDGTQNVISYFLVPSPSSTENGYAAAGGTQTAIDSDQDPDELIEILSAIFNSILSVSTTFVAPSVPVNVFNRSQTEDQVFLALFKADENGLPFWPGNLKKLNIGDVTLPDGTASFELQDANNVAAIDTDGRIKLDALTVWTDTGDTDMVGVIEDEAADGADGRAVTRGGVGQQIPGYLPVATGDPGLLNATTGARQLFTDDSASTPANFVALDATAANAVDITGFFAELTRSWTPLQVDNVTPATTYANTRPVDQAKILDLLEYARGLEADGVTKRSWMIGDPLHSRPLTINYGERGAYDDSDPNNNNPDIRIFFGTNDGFFHSIRNTDSSGTETGDEVWAYMPREAMAVLEPLFEGIAITDPIHPITIDGSPIAVVFDGNGDNNIEGVTDYAIILFGLRRGGKSYYAIDVTNPDSPDLLYRIGKYTNPLDPAASTLNAGFEELSMTFSTPAAGFIDISGVSTPVFIFGGGYNGDDAGDNVDDLAGYQDPTVLGKDQANRDENNAVSPVTLGDDDEDEGTDQYEGNAIYIINAQTGALVWKATGADTLTGTGILNDNRMLDSVPSELTAVDTTGDGQINRIYWGDTGGRVWRADVGGGVVGSFDVHLILDAGRHVVADRENDRRFFNRPDVVQATDGTNKFDAVLIGSGDRENPKGTDVENAFFMIKDPNIGLSGADTGFVHSNGGTQSLADLTNNCLQTSDESTCGVDLTNGWFMELGLGTTGTGEKNLAPALTLGGTVFFTTFSPTAGVCGLSEGSGKQFAVNLLDATALYNYNTSNDGSSSYPEDRFDVIESGGIPVEPVTLGKDILLFQGQAGEETIQNTGATTSWHTYWYELDN